MTTTPCPVCDIPCVLCGGVTIHTAVHALAERLAKLEAREETACGRCGLTCVLCNDKVKVMSFEQLVAKVGPLPSTGLASAEQGPRRACLVFPSETCDEEGRCVYECQRKNRPASAEGRPVCADWCGTMVDACRYGRRPHACFGANDFNGCGRLEPCYCTEPCYKSCRPLNPAPKPESSWLPLGQHPGGACESWCWPPPHTKYSHECTAYCRDRARATKPREDDQDSTTTETNYATWQRVADASADPEARPERAATPVVEGTDPPSPVSPQGREDAAPPIAIMPAGRAGEVANVEGLSMADALGGETPWAQLAQSARDMTAKLATAESERNHWRADCDTWKRAALTAEARLGRVDRERDEARAQATRVALAGKETVGEAMVAAERERCLAWVASWGVNYRWKECLDAIASGAPAPGAAKETT